MPTEATSDDFAHEILSLVTTAGGSWWLALIESRPESAADLLAAVPGDLCPIAPVEVPRDSLTWSTPAGREVHLLADVSMPASTGDCSPAAWVLFDDEALTVPRVRGWLPDLISGPLPSGSAVFIPGDSINLLA